MSCSHAADGVKRRHGSPLLAMSDRASSPPTLLERDLATPNRAMAPLTRYPGGKNGAGIWQRLISLMPPHSVYIEAFLGSGAILRRKLPAPAGNIGIDVDAGVIAAHGVGGHYDVVQADAREWLKQQRWGHGGISRGLIYADPPYLGSARLRPGRAVYRHEMLSDGEHVELLRILTALPTMVMISGYASSLYDQALKTWRRVEYSAMTRGGMVRECVWMNYPEPSELHDYRWLGEDFHDRCRIRRKIDRWTRRLQALPALERAAVIDALGIAVPEKG